MVRFVHVFVLTGILGSLSVNGRPSAMDLNIAFDGYLNEFKSGRSSARDVATVSRNHRPPSDSNSYFTPGNYLSVDTPRMEWDGLISNLVRSGDVRVERHEVIVQLRTSAKVRANLSATFGDNDVDSEFREGTADVTYNFEIRLTINDGQLVDPSISIKSLTWNNLECTKTGPEPAVMSLYDWSDDICDTWQETYSRDMVTGAEKILSNGLESVDK